MKLEPFHNYVVLRTTPAPRPQKRARKRALVQGVVLDETPNVHAEVVAIGPEVYDLKVGDHVLVSRVQGYTIELGEPLLVVRESAVLAHV